MLADNRKVVGGDGRQLIYVPMAGQGGTTGTRNESALPLVPQDVLVPQSTQQPDRAGDPRPVRPTRPTGREGATR